MRSLGRRRLCRRPARSPRAALAPTLARSSVRCEAARVQPQAAAPGPSPRPLTAGCAGSHAAADLNESQAAAPQPSPRPLIAGGAGPHAGTPSVRARRHACGLGRWRRHPGRRPARSSRAALAHTPARTSMRARRHACGRRRRRAGRRNARSTGRELGRPWTPDDRLGCCGHAKALPARSTQDRQLGPKDARALAHAIPCSGAPTVAPPAPRAALAPRRSGRRRARSSRAALAPTRRAPL